MQCPGMHVHITIFTGLYLFYVGKEHEYSSIYSRLQQTISKTRDFAETSEFPDFCDAQRYFIKSCMYV